MNDRAYWDSYYISNPPINDPSDFAVFVSGYIQSDKRMVDLGCGNGRDSLYFINSGVNVLGVDSSQAAIDKLNLNTYSNAEFVCADFTDSLIIYGAVSDYFYSRFTIHAITKEKQDVLFNNVYKSLNPGGYFFIEVRSVNDDIFGKGESAGRNSYVYNGHYRRFIVKDEIARELSEDGFAVLYNEEARGFAKFGEDDPLIIRIIARKY